MIYHLLSDTHFNHTKLEDWGGRSGDWQEQLLIGVSKIPKDEVLVHLGDFCIGNDLECSSEFFKHAPRTNILVRGNHDKKSAAWYLEHGWSFVCDSLSLDNYRGETILFSHRPMHPDMWRYTKNIHGHTHGNMHRAEEHGSFYSYDFHIDISPEFIGYKPVQLDWLLKNWKPQQHQET